ncbi:DUF397 domain-containing protein [Streptomyces prunicolor]
MNTTGLAWFKSSCSTKEGGACLEIAPTLGATPTTWTEFLRAVR